ncbi:exo-alpha-sialidase [Olivibacter sp. SDN3]|uniref:sialidase family protein n=1 Tax=Olivibacter sp. SDN3 TaxID=2764720 RepID=UPI00165161CA|nr:sialidase family protein [Olivibacter sp. SDN3]QNL52022.1 exo-alpha-sialidase [Olivibacter sp. SDN3]
MHYLIILVVACSVSLLAQAKEKDISVFVSGQEGYKSFRIPAMIKAPDGSLLAFCEGRVEHAGDFGDIDIVMKRSTDGGKSWGDLHRVVDYSDLQAGNPAPVVDFLDPAYPDGRIFLFYNTGNNHEGEVRKGKGLREVWYVTSEDDGRTWSEPVNITLAVHRPKQPQQNKAYNFSEDWRSYANTPGHAVQFGQGKFEGRIFVAANHSSGEPQEAFKDYSAHGYYTDDHGKTFKLSEDVPFEGGNESMAAVIGVDSLVMNSRNQQGNVRSRIVSISSDGGATWDTTYYDRQLPDPVNQGSVLSFNDKKKGVVLAFCNAADTAARNNLTLRLSDDGGRSWFFQKTIARREQPGKGDHAAYSDMVQVNKRRIGVLFEKNGYKEIVFRPVKW